MSQNEIDQVSNPYIAEAMAYAYAPFYDAANLIGTISNDQVTNVILSEGERLSILAGFEAIDTVADKQINDVDLAHDLASLEDRHTDILQISKKFGYTALAEPIQSSLQAESKKIIDAYQEYNYTELSKYGLIAVRGSEFVDRQQLLDAVNRKLPIIKFEDIESQFDTTPISKKELVKLGDNLGLSKAIVSSTWRALTYLDTKGVTFHTKVGQGYNTEFDNVDIEGLIRLLQEIETDLISNSGFNTFVYSSVLGQNRGKGVHDTIKAVVLSRLKTV